MQPSIHDYFSNDQTIDKPVRERIDKDFYASLPKKPIEEPDCQKKDIYCNAFKVNFSSMNLTNYEARFEPETENTSLKRALLYAHFQRRVITDGRMVSVPEEVPEDKRNFQIKARNQQVFEVELVPATGSNDLDIQKANMLLKSIIIDGNKKMVSWKKSFFDVSKPEEFTSDRGARLAVLQGFSSTTQIFDTDPYLVIDKSFRCLRTQTYLDSIRSKDQDTIKKEFQPMVLYNSQTKRLEKIDDIDFGKNPSFSFTRKDGSSVSIAEYYKQRYQIEIRDMDQPLLVQKKIEKDSEGKEVEKQPCYFVPELMRLTGMSDDMRADNQFMRKLADLFSADPQKKMDSLKSIVDGNIQNIPDLKQWKINVEREPACFSSYVLHNPQIISKNRNIDVPSNRDWRTDIKNFVFYDLKPLDRWTAIVPSQCMSEFNSFEHQLSNFYDRMKISYRQPNVINLSGTNIDQYKPDLKNSSMVLAVSVTDSIYEQIKKFCVDENVPTQCIKPNTLRRQSLTPIIQMITLQMQSKMGGIPWKTEIDSGFSDGMTVGIDVISAGKDREIVAIVSSVDKSFTVYKKSSVVEKKGLHTAGIHIGEFMKKALESYTEYNGSHPKKVIIYRGSANTGDLKNIQQGELVEVKKAIAEYDQTIQFIYITVNNKHDMKFFSKDGNNFINPLPGTVITQGVTKTDLFQFYLVSHVPRKGLVKPSMYFVLENTIENLSQLSLYNLTYELAHLYFNGANSVCFPTPLYQANKFCKMLNDCGYVEGTRKSSRGGNGGFQRGGRGFGGGNGRGRGAERREDRRRDDRDRHDYDRRDDRDRRDYYDRRDDRDRRDYYDRRDDRDRHEYESSRRDDRDRHGYSSSRRDDRYDYESSRRDDRDRHGYSSSRRDDRDRYEESSRRDDRDRHGYSSSRRDDRGDRYDDRSPRRDDRSSNRREDRDHHH
ncbi:hypothetical protein, conserved [Entamoeba dispar SAW760]|uniref:Piwi domain-containing protein n=1 Tax=Entamoeba dispar (strain ATCC PRA-260 / SAW760) TaxID=370354 RepID=B0ET37_ENTDS|nr:uncharacterized protein EDI_106590 [Entamoeba dispar SAW760]EDR22290.1 hypothetical protein, conserved [Entamoeba dispar SAW760]|eukprot:EDR22290.1 hypothetical protein, conserved [Entamoeba dispar SAW760]